MEFPGTKRFELERRLGTGEMGEVFQAIDRERGDTVALKTLRATSPDSLLRFKNEFRALQSLHHRNLVNLGELFEHNGHWFFTMELIQGATFLNWVQPGDNDRGAFSGPRLRDALRQLATGLATLHAADKVHRDIKPSNVLVTPSGRVVILDFGLVAQRDVTSPWSHSNIVGTVQYMAPEQATGEPVGPAADWYSVGVMLFEALTGEAPFDGTPAEVIIKKRTQRAPRATEWIAALPPELVELTAQLLHTAPDARAGAEQVLAVLEGNPLARTTLRRISRSPATGTPTPPFVGRRRELARLTQLAARAAPGAPVALLITGESGVGKSALVSQFLAQTAEHDPTAIVLRSACYERESVPYKAFDGIIDELAQLMLSLPEPEQPQLKPAQRTVLTTTFPVLARVEAMCAPSPAPVDELEPHEQRRNMFSALRELLTQLAARQRLLVVLDDLQWADDDSLALASELLREPDAPGLCFIATTRQSCESLPRLCANTQSISLDVLAPNTARTLARLLLPRRTEFASPAGIAVEARGHPMFIAELARRATDGIAHADQPLRLDDALWSRVADLDEASRDILLLAATAESPLRQAALSRASNQPFAKFAERIARLRAAQLVRTLGTNPEDAVQLYHDRIREVVTERLPPIEQTKLHHRLADALSANAAHDDEALAFHYDRAQRPELAARHYHVAARRAERALAFGRAAELYSRAIELATAESSSEPGDHKDADAAALLGSLGRALGLSGRAEESAQAYQRAADLSEEPDHIRYRLSAGDQFLRCGQFERGIAMAEPALRELGVRLPTTTSSALVRLMFTRARVRTRGTRLKVRPEGKLPSLELQRLSWLWAICSSMSITDPMIGSYLQSRYYLRALRAGSARHAARALALESCYAAFSGERSRRRVAKLAEAATSLATSVRAAGDSEDGSVDEPIDSEQVVPVQLPQLDASPEAPSQADDDLTLAFVGAGQALCEYHSERWRTAIEHIDRTAPILRRCRGADYERHLGQLLRGFSLFYLGDLRELGVLASLCRREATSRGDTMRAGDWEIGLFSVLALADHDLPGSLAAIDRARERWPAHDTHVRPYWNLFGELMTQLYAGESAAAWELVTERWSTLHRSQILRMAMPGKEMLHIRGRCAVAAGKPREALRDAARLERTGTPCGLAFGTLLRAGAAARLGDRDGAAAALRSAIELCRAADLRLFEAAARHRLGNLLPGEAGRRAIAKAEAFMTDQGIREPRRFALMLVPGTLG